MSNKIHIAVCALPSGSSPRNWGVVLQKDNDRHLWIVREKLFLQNAHEVAESLSQFLGVPILKEDEKPVVLKRRKK